MEDFYTYHLVPKYQSWLSQAGLSLVLDGVVVRHVMSALEMLTAFLCLLNWRKAGALLALLILLSGSKNVGERSIDIPHLGSFKVYPNAFIQTIIAALIIVLPSGASKKRSEKEDDRLKQQ